MSLVWSRDSFQYHQLPILKDVPDGRWCSRTGIQHSFNKELLIFSWGWLCSYSNSSFKRPALLGRCIDMSCITSWFYFSILLHKLHQWMTGIFWHWPLSCPQQFYVLFLEGYPCWKKSWISAWLTKKKRWSLKFKFLNGKSHHIFIYARPVPSSFKLEKSLLCELNTSLINP